MKHQALLLGGLALIGLALRRSPSPVVPTATPEKSTTSTKRPVPSPAHTSDEASPGHVVQGVSVEFETSAWGDMERLCREAARAAFRDVLAEDGSLSDAREHAQDVFLLMGGDDPSFLDNLRVKELV